MLTIRKNRLMSKVMMAITLGFLLLTLLVVFFPTSIIDREFSEEVQEHQNHFLDSLMELISWFGYMPHSLIMILMTALTFFIFKYKREAAFILITSLSGLISTLIKLLVNRPRPSDKLVRVVQKVNQQSFPSGHVLFYVIFFGFLSLLMYQLQTIPKFIRIGVSAIAILLIFSVPLSRIYLGAHWFTDVTGGFLLGLVCLYLLSYFYEKQVKTS